MPTFFGGPLAHTFSALYTDKQGFDYSEMILQQKRMLLTTIRRHVASGGDHAVSKMLKAADAAAECGVVALQLTQALVGITRIATEVQVVIASVARAAEREQAEVNGSIGSLAVATVVDDDDLDDFEEASPSKVDHALRFG